MTASKPDLEAFSSDGRQTKHQSVAYRYQTTRPSRKAVPITNHYGARSIKPSTIIHPPFIKLDCVLHSTRGIPMKLKMIAMSRCKFFGSTVNGSKVIAQNFCSSSAVASQSVVELREYSLLPEYAADFMKEATDAGDLRKDLTPLRLFTQPDTGGTLNVATHAYYYEGGLVERESTRQKMASNPQWQTFVANTRSFVHSQKSTIFAEAPIVRQANLAGLSTVPESQPGDNAIIELRRYNLKLGYDTVPKFLELYGAGLPSKLNAEGTDPTTSLVTLLYTEVGRLNEVIEVWRHGNGVAAMEQSRVAARSAMEWRTAIAGIADLAIEFSSTIHKPLGFSPIR